ncbi:Uncharacterized conserved protein, DUF1800 family [Hymenobacter daecheongensis DSM 21074]|uniref:Uncharacterized conserved protein, DUF1800 family n=1 Tax=Hymenobacter daecheongensis DSM 21074 TaxID=1121955 RepID=A0A1M6IT34_9BACT|nr:DUF1800 domain-containing protein [Hymenobacter daecheongensis]SHJ37578.1 Uncharacterized conserved protein, DUF1800 family [Hymenobacter daecheongensis DSM 21074]
MDRRSFLRKNTDVLTAPALAAAPLPARPTAADDDEPISKFANKQLPTTARSTAGLAPYTGTWGYTQAAHLLRRSLFGPTRTEIVAAAGRTLTQVLNDLLTAPAAPAPPLNVSATDTSVAVGQTWVTQAFDQNFEGVRRSSLRAWWLGQMLGQTMSLAEKMTLFWHNHFVVELGDINDARFGYQYAALLRQHALGNIKQLAKDVTVNPAMLRYLNGNQSTAGAPNENYGRELLELFTVGKGPLIGAGNYTTYTEADVQAAARVLTGWRDSAANLNSYYTASRHDTTTKQFSAAFGSASIANGGDQEYKALIDLIFAQPETARFLCRKLYRWFVYYVIDATTEQNVIEPLAQLLIQNGYNVGPVLRTLLSSEHFFDSVNMGCVIKSPIDFTLTVARQLQITFPPASSVVAQYGMWDYLNGITNLQQQVVGDPPNVAGWAAYWQTPQYYEIWINAVTLPRRNQFTDQMISTNGYTRNGAKINIDALALVLALPAATASDANLLIAELTRLLFPIPLTANQLAYLNDVLLPGLPDFEWTDEWTQYLANPTNVAKKTAVTTKLQALLRSMMGLAEYHLS